MKTIKAIETEYNYVKYRSKNEARWAVFLDCLGIDFQYEPQGYEMTDGNKTIKYLPDFFIPKSGMFDQDLYLEIKPSNCDVIISESSLKKVEAFSSHYRITILGTVNDYLNNVNGSDGGPNGSDYYCLWPNDENLTDVNGVLINHLGDVGYLFCQCIHCGCFGFEYNGRSERINCCDKNIDHKIYNYDADIIIKALHEARSHRFWK